MMISDATKKLIAVANELREMEIKHLRAGTAYYTRNSEMYETWKAAKAAAITMRGTAGELDALRAWLEIDIEWNNMKRPELDTDNKWHETMKKAWHAIAADVGLHLSISEDPLNFVVLAPPFS
jgi:hypothetical protein